MIFAFILPNLNPFPFVDGVFHFGTEPVEKGMHVLKGFQVGFQHQSGRFDDAARLDGQFRRIGRGAAIRCQLGLPSV